MASLFPASVDTFSTPTAGSATSSPSHATLHVNVNNAITNAQTYMGLVLVTSATIGSAVSSVTVSNAFSATYDNYLIKITGMTGSASVDTNFQLGGITTGVYITSGFYQLLSSATITTYTTTTTVMPMGTMGSTQNTQITIDISAPNLAVTKYISMRTQSSYLSAIGATQVGSTVQATAFTLTPASGTLSGGTIRVYGYRQ